MSKISFNLDIRGETNHAEGIYLFRDSLLKTDRKGSIVRVSEKDVELLPDVTGIDKLYYRIEGDNVRISGRFRDFLPAPLDIRFLEFQKTKGYVPYPYTILEGVKKAPPGLRTIISRGTDNSIYCRYSSSPELDMFSSGSRFSRRTFKEDFTRIMEGLRSDMLVSSLSGGFDSLLLTTLYRKRCSHLLHFSEKKDGIENLKHMFPGMGWTVVDNDEPITDADRKNYFESIDEPLCDSAGFAEYLMVKRLKQDLDGKALSVMNGQAADALFCNGLIYFRNHFSSRLPVNWNIGIKGKDSFQGQSSSSRSSLSSRIRKYMIDTKTRFFNFYFPQEGMGSDVLDEFEEVFHAYSASIKNDSTNFLAALIFLLKYSLHGVEKIKVSARANGMGYFLPFMSREAVRFAFSVPSRYKVGRKAGKKILRDSFPELREAGYDIAAFLPQSLKDRFAGRSVSGGGYELFYIEGWAKANRIKLHGVEGK